MKDTNTNKSSVLKQLFGAVVGATVALGIYYVYDFGSPVVSAWLISNKVTSDETPVVINDIDEHTYLDLLVKTNQIDSALKCAWYEFKDNEFSTAPDFKANFRISYLNKLFNKGEGNSLNIRNS